MKNGAKSAKIESVHRSETSVRQGETSTGGGQMFMGQRQSMRRGQNCGKCALGVDILDHRKMKKSRVKLHKKIIGKGGKWADFLGSCAKYTMTF